MMQRANLIDSRGKPIALGNPLGREGGEGCVYEITDRRDLVAKIYREAPSQDKIDKLIQMIRIPSDGLLRACAWPVDLVRSKRDNQLLGVVMPRVPGSEIHNLYNPRARYVQFPKVKWDQLVWTARNVAAAFDTLHKHGVIMGDVNEGNVLVHDNGTVKLIDCDSYQITSSGKDYVCGVGIGLWTPPELQSANLQFSRRTPNHDLFGLAQIIFLLLFMGRHPFAGVAKSAEDYDLEEAIQRYLFAYNPNDPRIRPPEVSLRIESLPADLGILFCKAFARGSELPSARPTAERWCQELERLGKNLRTCPRDSAHIYAVHLHTCPWCEIQEQHGLNFFWSAGTVVIPTRGTQDLQRLVNAIQNLQPLPRVYKNPSEIACPKVTPVRTTVPRINRTFIWGWLVLAGSIVAMILGVYIGFLGILVAMSMICSGKQHPDFAREKTSRRAAVDRTTEQLVALEKTVSKEFERYSRDFQKKQHELLTIADKLRNWDREEARIRAETEAKKRELQLRAFLDRQLISQATIPNVGDKRKAKLAAYGVETALDVNKSIVTIPGFARGLFENLQRWRASCERLFRFDPRALLAPEIIRDMQNRIIQTKNYLESEIRSGPEQLNRLNTAMQMKISQYHSQLPVLVRNKAQAEANLRSIAG